MADAAVVLIAEDNQAIAGAVAQRVEAAGATALVAYDGWQALDLAQTHGLSLVITDLAMPYLDGRELVQALRLHTAIEDYAMPPVILMTTATPSQARGIEADAILPKPFGQLELDTLLRRFLG